MACACVVWRASEPAQGIGCRITVRGSVVIERLFNLVAGDRVQDNLSESWQHPRARPLEHVYDKKQGCELHGPSVAMVTNTTCPPALSADHADVAAGRVLPE